MVSAAPLGVGYREAVDIPVAEGSLSNFTDRLMISEGAFNKTGDGALALAVSNLTMQSGGTLTVRNGELRITSGQSRAPAPAPLNVLADAAFWVDAAVNVVTVSSNGSTYADAWLDVREPGTAAPFTYPRAVAAFNKTNCAPEVQMNAGPDGSLPSLWFGRINSLRWMNWTKPDGTTADIANICHVFVVHGAFQSFGYVLGTANNTNPDFHISDYNNGSLSQPIWHPREWATTAIRQGRTYLDGERVDGTLATPKTGWQVLEVALGTKTAHASNFFNDRDIDFAGKRIGGDNLCEVVVFTNRLSGTDRLRVQHYLRQKWLAPEPLPALALRASASATVTADVATDDTLTFRLNGDGAFQKQGTGTAVLENTPSVTALFRSAALLDGYLDSRVPVPLALAAGSRVTTSNTVIAVSQDAGSGRIIKEGDGTATMTVVPSDLANLDVNGGTLILTPPAIGTSVANATTGSVPNATFEAEQLGSYRRNIANDATYQGWTASFPAPTGSADNAVFIFNRSQSDSGTQWPCNHNAPEGNQVLALKQDASASTTLSLPVAGIYDISFYTSARAISTGRHEFDLCIVDSTATNRIATVQTINAAYVRQSFRLPWLEAGDHTLLFHRTVMGVDTLGTIDDIRVTLAADQKLNTVEIFNGDFELTEYPREPASFVTANRVPGWTLSESDNGVPLANITMTGSSSSFYSPSSPYGAVLLGIHSNGAASTTLTLPAGTYRLQGDICNWTCALPSGNLTGTQSFLATVTRGSGSTDTLGALSTDASILTTMTWPNAFTVTNNETVTLAIAGQGARSGGLVDNLALVPGASPIVQNGGFEEGDAWIFEYNTAVQPKDEAKYNHNTLDAYHYGSAAYDGDRRLLLVQTGAAVQDIQIPAPGLYRLVFHATTRDPTYNEDLGSNPVRAWLARDGATNVIGWTRADDTVFVRREFLFQVAEAGAYRFGLQGMTDNSAEFPGNDRSALLDGVSIEPAADLAPDGIPLPRGLVVSVDSGAHLQLSFTGIQQVDSVRLGGRFATGVINQETHPAFISGPGALHASQKGTALLIK